MEKKISTASIVVGLLILASQESLVGSQETCNILKWMMCEKGMPQAGKFSLPKYVRVENFLCDTQTDGGGWIVFQRRIKGDTKFNRTWQDYKIGFGSKCNDYWLGNDYLHIATKWGSYELRIDMSHKGNYYFAQYSKFKVDSEENNYRLTATGFTGNVSSDELAVHSGRPFSTADVDNTVPDPFSPPGNCGIYFQAGWWYYYAGCHNANLNGIFGIPLDVRGVVWPGLTANVDHPSSVEMKLRLKG